MLRQNLTILLVCLAISTFSQTFFYARAITTLPEKSTHTDNISIDVFGDLSVTNAIVANTSFSITDFEINITLDCTADGTGKEILKPHKETVTLGTLPAGKYKITLWGTGLADFVLDTADYYLNVRDAQSINNDLALTSKPTYDLYVDPDSGLIQVTQDDVSNGIDLIQIIDMKGKVVMQQSMNKEKLAQLTLPAGKRGIFLVSVKSGDYVWSDIFSLPK